MSPATFADPDGHGIDQPGILFNTSRGVLANAWSPGVTMAAGSATQVDAVLGPTGASGSWRWASRGSSVGVPFDDDPQSARQTVLLFVPADDGGFCRSNDPVVTVVPVRRRNDPALEVR